MKTNTPSLSVEEQNKAADMINQLIAQGYSSGDAIKAVAEKIRKEHQGEYIHVKFDEDDE